MHNTAKLHPTGTYLERGVFLFSSLAKEFPVARTFALANTLDSE
jgi:hypothetical protein